MLIKHLTQEEAIAFAKSDAWKRWSSEKLVKFQLFQNELCVDPAAFHAALEDVLGRSVSRHELDSNYQGIVSEYLVKHAPPTFQEIVDLFPSEEQIVVALGKAGGRLPVQVSDSHPPRRTKRSSKQTTQAEQAYPSAG